MNCRPCIRRGRTTLNCPCTRFILSGREERDKVEHGIPSLDKVVHTVVRNAEFAPEVGALIFMHVRELALHARVHEDPCGF